jgi:histidine ammonia-lyase
LARVIAHLRTKVATLGDDRFIAPDLAAAAALVADGSLAAAAHIPLPEL